MHAQLSPLNRHGIMARLLASDTPVANETRRIEEVVMFRCPECSELHEFEDEAKDCCKPAIEQTSAAVCPVCGEKYFTHRDAADCCLWKDFDAPTRWRIADAVEAGSEWISELSFK